MPTIMYAAICESCSEDIDRSVDFYNYCDECSEYRCEDCGPCPLDHSDSWYDDDDDCGSGGCDCSDCRPYGDARVHDYSYRPRNWNPKGEFPMRPLMGVELEVQNYRPERIADTVSEFDPDENHLFVKEDGSLDSGLEIVSHPATLEWSRGFNWDLLLSELRANGCDTRDGYGLHVHVSRNAFRRHGTRSATHQLTWLLFLHRNPRQLERLARRSSEQWAKFQKPRRKELLAKAIAHNGYSGDRYVAVNCNNQKTYELRFFRSTLDFTEFMAALEFADASVEYTRGIKTADVLRGQALSWRHFAQWVREHDYPNLASEIEEQGTEHVTTPPEDVVNRRRIPEPEPPRTTSRFSVTVPRPGSEAMTGCTCELCEAQRRRERLMSYLTSDPFASSAGAF